jgi:hypothetical protein
MIPSNSSSSGSASITVTNAPTQLWNSKKVMAYANDDYYKSSSDMNEIIPVSENVHESIVPDTEKNVIINPQKNDLAEHVNERPKSVVVNQEYKRTLETKMENITVNFFHDILSTIWSEFCSE